MQNGGAEKPARGGIVRSLICQLLRRVSHVLRAELKGYLGHVSQWGRLVPRKDGPRKGVQLEDDAGCDGMEDMGLYSCRSTALGLFL